MTTSTGLGGRDSRISHVDFMWKKTSAEGVGCKQPTSSAPFSGDRLLEVDFPIPYRECDIRYIGSFELNSDLF